MLPNDAVQRNQHWEGIEVGRYFDALGGREAVLRSVYGR